MRQASPFIRAEFSHENRFMTVINFKISWPFQSTLWFPHSKTKLTKLSNVIPVVFHGQYKVFF